MSKGQGTDLEAAPLSDAQIAAYAAGEAAFQIPRDMQGIKGAVVKVVAPFAERILRFPELNECNRITHSLSDERSVANRMLESLKVHVVIKPEYLAQIPTEGPVIVVANHPFGGVEGIVLADILGQVRPDFKLLANEMLGMVPVASGSDKQYPLSKMGLPQTQSAPICISIMLMGLLWIC